MSDERPPWGVRDVVYATLSSALVFAVFAAITATVSVMRDESGSSSFPAWTLASFYVIFVAIAWYFSVRRYKARWGSLGFRAPSGSWGAVLTALCLAGTLSAFIAYRLAVERLGVGWLQPQELPPEVFGFGLDRVLNVFAIVGIAPLAEEVFFRGFVLGGLAAAFGDLRAAIASSALFAVMHVSVATFIPLFVAGLLLAWLYLRTRSIWPPIAAHSTQNALALLGQTVA